MRLVTLCLLALIALVQTSLWFGRGSVPHVMELQAKLDEQKTRNDEARARNVQAEAEVSDLKEGLEMVEEKARSELGMVKPDEILVQIATTRTSARATSPATAAANTPANMPAIAPATPRVAPAASAATALR